jgi:F0F1-type ATP synthase assembly protein I
MSLGFILILILAATLYLWGQRKQWGVAPVGLLGGLVFIVPIFMLLIGIL